MLGYPSQDSNLVHCRNKCTQYSSNLETGNGALLNKVYAPRRMLHDPSIIPALLTHFGTHTRAENLSGD